MKIDRAELIEGLSRFVREGSGLVIGPPGVGKTYAIGELCRSLQRERIPHLFLPVESLGSGGPSDVEALFKRKGDFIEILSSLKDRSTSPAVLIFDGFDAARGETERAGVLNLIQRSVTHLSKSWNVVVTVRTFDAKKSQRLHDLFPDETCNSVKGSRSRIFEVQGLTPADLDQAMSQVNGLGGIYSMATPEFKKLITTPFNLWLVERVLADGAQHVELSSVTSEVQMLELYWRYRVMNAPDGENREFIIAETAREMVANCVLFAKRDRVYRPELQLAWKGLLSAEVLTEIQSRSGHFAFSHNILFDFAVSVHLLDADPKHFAAFIAQEPARPLFLRASLVYHFSRLWHTNRDTFWHNFWSVIEQSSIYLRQVVRLVLPTVVVNEARSINDLQPLLLKLKLESPSSHGVAFVLQALKVLDPTRPLLWSDFLVRVADQLDINFAWDAGTIAERLLANSKTATRQLRVNCGTLGLKLLRWCWIGRDAGENQAWYERLATVVAIPLVIKTYDTSPVVARELLEPILGVIGKTKFPIDCVWRLTNEVPNIIPHDPSFVREVYDAVFSYKENSAEATHMGGRVMPLSSTRRQDYNMCRYALIEAYPQFLSRCPEHAIPAGILAIQSHVMQEHVNKYRNKSDLAQEPHLEFAFWGIKARYLADRSVVWGASGHPDREMRLADELFGWLGNAAKDSKLDEVQLFLTEFCKHNYTAVLWARLLQASAEFPKMLAQKVWELAKDANLLCEVDLLVAIGSYLEEATPYLDEEKRTLIERAIVSLPNRGSKDDRPALERKRDRLLARIPLEKLVTPEAKDLREELVARGALPSNDPLFKFSSAFGSYTEEDHLRDSGVAIEQPANKRVRDSYRPLKEWNDRGKDASQITPLTEVASNLLLILDDSPSADTAVRNAAWAHLASFACEAVSLLDSNEGPNFAKLRKILLLAATHVEPHFDEKFDTNWNSASWSPAPRHEAAQGLPHIAGFSSDGEVNNAIAALTRDSVPSVRFLVLSEIWRLADHVSTDMWRLIEEVAAHETNSVVLQGLSSSMWNLFERDKAKTLQVIKTLLQRTESQPEEFDKVRSHLISMLVDLAVDGENWATSRLESWQSNPLENAHSLSMSGSRLIEYMRPEQIGERMSSARTLLLRQLDAVAKGLTLLQNFDEIRLKQQQWQLLYGVIDQTIMRIQFSADIDHRMQGDHAKVLSDEARQKFFMETLPVLNKVISLGMQPKTGVLLAPTAHYFMELFNGVLIYDVAHVLQMASEVVACSRRFNYTLDSVAMQETLKLVERILVDYRDKVQTDESIKALLEILDAFVDAGWPEALQLVWRLDEIYK